MGESYLIANLDKKEFIDADRLGLSSRFDSLFELPVSGMLAWLIAERDWVKNDSLLGSWAGDRIVAAGDGGAAAPIWDAARGGGEWRDLTVQCFETFVRNLPWLAEDYRLVGMIDRDGHFVGDWQRRLYGPKRAANLEEPAERLEGAAEWRRAMADYYGRMRAIYEHAATRPWEAIPGLPLAPPEP